MVAWRESGGPGTGRSVCPGGSVGGRAPARRARGLLLLTLLLALAPRLPAGELPYDAVFKIGDRVNGTLPSGGMHVLYFEAVAGTEVTLKAVRTSGFMLVGLRLYDPTLELLVDEVQSVLTLKKAAITARRLATTGTYRLEVVDLTEQGGGTYALRTAGVRDRLITELVTVDGLQPPPPIQLIGVAGEIVQSISVRSLKPKGLFSKVGGLPAALLPEVAQFVQLGGEELDLSHHTFVSPSGRKVVVTHVVLPQLGEYALHVGGANASVGYASVKLRRAPLQQGSKLHVIP